MSNTARRMMMASGGASEYTPYDAANMRPQGYSTQATSSAQDVTNPRGGIRWTPDGTILYTCISANDQYLYQSTIDSTDGLAWSTYDMDTAVYAAIRSGGTGAATQDMFFNDDGTIVYWLVPSIGKVQSQTLDVAYDIGGSTLGPLTDEITGLSTDVSSMDIKPDGTKLYFFLDTGSAEEWDVNPAWDISEAADSGDDLNFTGTSYVVGRFTSDGTKLYLTDNTSTLVNIWGVDTPWDVSTASTPAATVSLDFTDSFGIKPDGSLMYHSDTAVDYIYMAALYPPNDASSVVAYTVAGPGNFKYTTGASGYSIWVDDTGTYLSRANVQGLLQMFKLTTPWDFTTMATYGTNLTIGASAVNAHVWSQDGRTYWCIRDTGSVCYVYQATASTPYQANTLGTTSTLNVTTQDINMRGMCWKSDGTKLYLCGTANNAVYEYSCSVAYDITSTVTYVRQLNTSVASGTAPKKISMDSTDSRLCVEFGAGQSSIYWGIYNITDGNLGDTSFDGDYYYPRHWNYGAESGAWNSTGTRYIQNDANFTTWSHTIFDIGADP